MALVEHLLTGRYDRVAVAIDRLRTFVPTDGQPYYLAFSGGKDSMVCRELCRMAGVPYELQCRITTVDPPELLRFIHANAPECQFSRGPLSMFDLIVKNGIPPTRVRRYCCRELKETRPVGRTIITGVRWEESVRRRKRQLFERLKTRDGVTSSVHPILDWTETEVWEFHTKYTLPRVCLYDEGWKRVGCVMCPQGGCARMRRDAARWPKIAKRYRQAIHSAWHIGIVDALRWFRPDTRRWGWHTPDAMWNWWIGTEDASNESECGLPLYDN